MGHTEASLALALDKSARWVADQLGHASQGLIWSCPALVDGEALGSLPSCSVLSFVLDRRRIVQR